MPPPVLAFITIAATVATTFASRNPAAPESAGPGAAPPIPSREDPAIAAARRRALAFRAGQGRLKTQLTGLDTGPPQVGIQTILG